jgi:hypothetical protein
MIIIKLMLAVTALYLFIGLLFAILFVIKGVEQVDEGAHGSSIRFRIIIIPGTMAFWPLLMRKWIKSTNQTGHD